MTSTTTCNYSQARVTQAGAPFVGNPTGGNQSFQWASSSCVTVSDPQATSTTEVIITGVEGLTVGIGFIVFLFSFLAFHAIMKLKTYDY
jgi:hypothetical protein